MRAVTELSVEAVKLAPPAATAGATLLGIPVPIIVQYLMLVYMIALVGHQFWRFIRYLRTRPWRG